MPYVAVLIKSVPCARADWLQIWAANTHLTNPHDFKLYQLINIGAMYPAREADTLADLAHRFRSDLRSLMVNYHNGSKREGGVSRGSERGRDGDRDGGRDTDIDTGTNRGRQGGRQGGRVSFLVLWLFLQPLPRADLCTSFLLFTTHTVLHGTCDDATVGKPRSQV